MNLVGFSVPISTALIQGDVVGDHQVPGNLEPGDTLLAVLQITDGAPPVVVSRTAEFSIKAGDDGVITNTTTDTTGKFLLVVWAKAAGAA